MFRACSYSNWGPEQLTAAYVDANSWLDMPYHKWGDFQDSTGVKMVKYLIYNYKVGPYDPVTNGVRSPL